MRICHSKRVVSAIVVLFMMLAVIVALCFSTIGSAPNV